MRQEDLKRHIQEYIKEDKICIAYGYQNKEGNIIPNKHSQEVALATRYNKRDLIRSRKNDIWYIPTKSRINIDIKFGHEEKSLICNEYLKHILKTGKLSLLYNTNLLIKEENGIFSLKFEEEDLIEEENIILLDQISKKYIKKNVCLNNENFEKGYIKTNKPGYYLLKSKDISKLNKVQIQTKEEIDITQEKWDEFKYYHMLCNVFNKDGVDYNKLIYGYNKQITVKDISITKISVKDTKINFYIPENIKKLENIWYTNEYLNKLKEKIDTLNYQILLCKIIEIEVEDTKKLQFVKQEVNFNIIKKHKDTYKVYKSLIKEKI